MYIYTFEFWSYRGVAVGQTLSLSFRAERGIWVWKNLSGKRNFEETPKFRHAKIQNYTLFRKMLAEKANKKATTGNIRADN